MIAFDYGGTCAVRCDVIDLGSGVYRIEHVHAAPLSDVDVCLRAGWSVSDGVGFIEDLACIAARHAHARIDGPLSVATCAVDARGFDLIAW